MMELKAKHPKMELKTKHHQMEMRNPVKRVGIEQIPADWNQEDETAVDYIKNKPDIDGINTSISTINGILEHKADVEELAYVAFSGDYDDLTNCPIGVSYFNNDAGYLTAHQDISGKANTADLAEVAFSGSYNDLTDKPSVEPEKVDYNISFDRFVGTAAVFVVNNPKEDIAEMIDDIRTGKANFQRALSLTYDPIDNLPYEGTTFPDYEFYGDWVVNSKKTLHKIIYYRNVAFDTNQSKWFLDIISFQVNINNNATMIYHSYIPMFDAIIIGTDGGASTYPASINITSSGSLWGKTNMAMAKNQRAGYSSNFNFKLRVLTHGDNVWLSPVETISANALPRFIGESEKLGKRIVVTFDNWNDTGHPTGTIDMTDLVDDTHINSLIDTKLGVVENGTY